MSPDTETRTYYFRAGAPEGGVFSGRLLAGSPGEALVQLRQKGFQPLRLETKPIREAWLSTQITLGGASRLTRSDCETFCRELALLLSAGLGLMDALSIMLQSLKKGFALAKFVAALRNGLRLGRSLSAAAESTNFSAPADFLPVIRAGEEAGGLPTALNMLAQSYADANRFSRTYSSALAYPALLLGVSFLVFGLIAFFVAPNLATLFTSMDRPVPFAVAVLSAAAALIENNLLPIGVASGLIVAGLAAGGASTRTLGYLRLLAFRLPFVGGAMSWSASQRFAATLRLYLASNVPIASALPNALMSAGFPSSAARAHRVADEVRGGARLAIALGKYGDLPPKLVHMIGVGENGGRLVEILDAVVAEAKNRFEQRMGLVSALLAPILILIVGSLIGTVILSVFSALLDINNVVL